MQNKNITPGGKKCLFTNINAANAAGYSQSFKGPGLLKKIQYALIAVPIQ